MSRPNTGTMQNWSHLWYEAANASKGIGIIVRSNRRDSLIATLNKTREMAADPDLHNLSLVRSPTSPAEIWIIKRRPDSNEPT